MLPELPELLKINRAQFYYMRLVTTAFSDGGFDSALSRIYRQSRVAVVYFPNEPIRRLLWITSNKFNERSPLIWDIQISGYTA